jgi:hypothetical protein
VRALQKLNLSSALAEPNGGRLRHVGVSRLQQIHPFGDAPRVFFMYLLELAGGEQVEVSSPSFFCFGGKVYCVTVCIAVDEL